MATEIVPLWRRSAIETADACLYRYRAIYEQGFVDEGDEARRGTAWHNAANVYVRALAGAQLPSDEARAHAALIEGFRISHTPAYLFNEVAGLWWPWVERFELDLDAFLLAEERQTHGGYAWRPDLVYARTDVLELVDFKTHWQVWAPSAAKAELQARWYAWQASKVWPGFPTYRVTFSFVRYGADVPCDFSLGEIDGVEPQVQASVDRIRQAQRTDAWPATPGAHCGFCRLECPTVDDALRAPVRVLDRLDAERLATEALALAQAHSARLEALAAFCATEGALTVNGMTYAHRPSEVLEFPAPAVVDAIRASGEAPEFTVGKTALSKYLTTRKRVHLRDPLLALARSSVRTTFTARKAADDAETEAPTA